MCKSKRRNIKSDEEAIISTKRQMVNVMAKDVMRKQGTGGKIILKRMLDKEIK
jgi:hypothetical protein